MHTRPLCGPILGMDLNTLKIKLAAVNLSRLARDTGINVRTLRRIRSGQTGDVLLTTMEKIEASLKKPPR